MAHPSASEHRPASLYSAYLVRIWREGADTPPRASVQRVGGSDIVRFATLDDLFAYLNAGAASTMTVQDRSAHAAGDANSGGTDE